jgi:nucleoid-associated protein YgaU
MGLFDFVKDAGERLFGGDDSDEQEVKATNEPRQRELREVLRDKKQGESMTRMVNAMELGVEDLHVKFRDGMATVAGTAPSQEVREKVILLLGNTQGVARVEDDIKVEKPEPEARMHTVVSGDSLSKIAKQYYGDAMKYPAIFEANQPMLKDPNKIYPGQVLRIPPLD